MLALGSWMFGGTGIGTLVCTKHIDLTFCFVLWEFCSTVDHFSSPITFEQLIIIDVAGRV